MFTLRNLLRVFLPLLLAISYPALAAEKESTPESPAASAPAESNLPDPVAKVGDEVISREEFEDVLAASRRMMSPRQGGDPVAAPTLSPQAQRDVLDKAIDATVLNILVKQSGTKVPDEEVNSQIDVVKSRLGSPERYEEFLKARGQTPEQYANNVREGLVAQKFMMDATKDVQASEEQVNAQAEELKKANQYDNLTTTDVAHILIKVSGTDEAQWEEGKKKIDAARARILGGEPFAKVANEVSEDPGSAATGGAYPNTPKGRMVAEFEKAMNETPIGKVSEPFRTQFGWHIVTVSARHAPEELIKERVLMMQRRDALMQMAKEARKNMKVEIFLPEAPAAGEGEASKAATPAPEAGQAPQPAPSVPQKKDEAPAPVAPAPGVEGSV
ncbi:MAG: peptidylprolyl isomerase [Candidatus Hydrogenedentes bacterium]|nr:peptidylprolyl isomerase [Candidatus Hydrogenedentota bacterium]